MSPRFASYPELKSKAAGRLWKRAIQRSSSSAYHEFPESSLDPPEPTTGKPSRVLPPMFVGFSTAASVPVQAGRWRLRRWAVSCQICSIVYQARHIRQYMSCRTRHQVPP